MREHGEDHRQKQEMVRVYGGMRDRGSRVMLRTRMWRWNGAVGGGCMKKCNL